MSIPKPNDATSLGDTLDHGPVPMLESRRRHDEPGDSAPGRVPLVSIAVPVYNGAKCVRTALDDLAAQTFRDYELVIVDNGSTDATAEICQARASEDPRIRYIRYEGTIPAADNFWRSVQLARGRYFAWNAADDRRPADAIERAMEVFRQYPDTVMVHGPVELDLVAEHRTLVVDNDVAADGTSPAERVAALCGRLRHNGMLYGLYRRDMLRRVILGPNRGHDSLVCLQMALIGPIRYVREPLVRYLHVHGPVDDPMYTRPRATLRSMLAWPSNRFKCWLVLGRGSGYLLREQGTPVMARLAATAAFMRTFYRRYASYLVVESMFAFVAPVACLLWPVTQPARRLRTARMERRRQRQAATEAVERHFTR